VLQLNVRTQELEIDDIALHALRTKLNKDRILSNDERVKMASSSFSSTFSPAVPGTALAKVQSRLLSSKTLASAVAGLLDDLRTVLNPPSKDAEGSESSEDEDDELASSALPTARKKKAMPQPVLSDEEAVDDDGWESGTVHDSDSGHEDNTGEEPEASDQLEHEDRQSLVGSEASDDESDSGSVAAPPPKKARQEIKKKAGPAESTFLPSLAVGFTRGDSDSEWSDSEAKIADGVHKNRRGQRARRAWVFSRGVSLFRVDIVPSGFGRRSMARTQRTSRSSGRSLLQKKTSREVSGLSTAAGRKLALNHNHGQRRWQGLIGQVKDPLGRRQPLPVCLILLL
jgi:hypothetical protein